MTEQEIMTDTTRHILETFADMTKTRQKEILPKINDLIDAANEHIAHRQDNNKEPDPWILMDLFDILVQTKVHEKELLMRICGEKDCYYYRLFCTLRKDTGNAKVQALLDQMLKNQGKYSAKRLSTIISEIKNGKDRNDTYEITDILMDYRYNDDQIYRVHAFAGTTYAACIKRGLDPRDHIKPDHEPVTIWGIMLAYDTLMGMNLSNHRINEIMATVANGPCKHKKAIRLMAYLMARGLDENSETFVLIQNDLPDTIAAYLLNTAQQTYDENLENQLMNALHEWEGYTPMLDGYYRKLYKNWTENAIHDIWRKDVRDTGRNGDELAMYLITESI